MYKNAKYIKSPKYNTMSICVEIDGVTSFVPIDPEIPIYAHIMKLVAEGKLVIAPAE